MNSVRANKDLRNGSISTSSVDSPCTGQRPPRVSLSTIETGLNINQFNSISPQRKVLMAEERASTVAACTSDSAPFSPATMANKSSTTTEWSSAVGHAMTGKSGRVIHNLQEDIARLTRECSLHRSRAEEAQRMNEALKQQLQTVMERLRHSEQAHEMDIAAIERKDRKIDDLKAEVIGEKRRRIQAEEDSRKTSQLAAEERVLHNRYLAEAQETSQQAQSQYETLSQARFRDRREYQSRLNRLRKELAELSTRETERRNQICRFDVVVEQKNREIAAGRDRMEHFSRIFEKYKADRDETMRSIAEKAQLHDLAINAAVIEAKEATDKMKWVMNVKKEIREAE